MVTFYGATQTSQILYFVILQVNSMQSTKSCNRATLHSEPIKKKLMKNGLPAYASRHSVRKTSRNTENKNNNNNTYSMS